MARATARSGDLSPAEAAAQIRFLEEEVALLRRKITESPRHVRILEQRLAESAGRLAQLSTRNEKLTETLKEARGQLVALREEVDRLAQPPSGYGVFLARFPDETVDVFTSGRRMRVAVSPAVDAEELRSGQTVRLNEALTVVEAGDFERIGEVCGLREVLASPPRTAWPAARWSSATPTRSAWCGSPRRSPCPRTTRTSSRSSPATRCSSTPRPATPTSGCPKAEVEDLVLEEVPDVAYEDIGGLFRQIEQIRDAVELPFLHAELFREYELRPPKGVLLYGPPGCGKTLIAKAVANSLAKKVAAVRGDDPNEAPVVLPQHQGPGAAQQVRRRDRAAHPADLPAGPREGVAPAPR